MNLLTQVLHIVGSGASAYITARNLRDAQTRPNLLAGFQLAESGSVPFLEKLRDRALAEGDNWLGEQLERHANDEKRHGQIFAQALKRHHKQVIDFKKQSEAEQIADKPEKKERQRSPFFDAYFKDYTSEQLKAENIDWIVFMGSTYILELDASKDFARMAKVLPDDDGVTASTKKGILSVAQDETRHAAYLLEALHRRLTPAEVANVIDEWRTRKVDALLAMVGNFVERQGQMRSLVQDAAPSQTHEEAELTELTAA
ncbi:MAG: ferritin-like domain-containing protein [Lyngbya sp.]|nr:ferritin-like domain-containing protein [Lyngbya sp.]